MKARQHIDDLQDSLLELDAAVSNARSIIDKLAAAIDVSRHDVDDAVEATIRQSRSLRALIAQVSQVVGVDVVSRTTRDELVLSIHALQDLLRERGTHRARLHSLASELETGNIVARQAARRARLQTLRAAALSEVRASFDNECAVMPWPSDPAASWVSWILALEEPDAGRVHAVLARLLPALLDWVTTLHVDEWKEVAGTADAVAQSVIALAASVSTEIEFASQATQSEGERSSSERQATSALRLGDSATSDEARRGDAGGFNAPMVSENAIDMALVVPATPVEATTNATDDVPRMPPHSVTAWQSEAEEPTGAEGEQKPRLVAEIGVSIPQTPGEGDSRQRAVALPMLELRDEITTFAQYRFHYWRDPLGQISEAPWCDPTFMPGLASIAEQAIAQRRWSHLYLHASAAANLGVSTVPRPSDVESLVSLLARPASPASGVDPNRAVRLFDDDSYPADSASLRLAVFLEGWRPCDGRAIDVEAAAHLVATAGFRSPAVRGLLDSCFRVLAEGGDPGEMLRRLHAQGASEPEQDLAVLAAAAQKKLHELHRRLWSAAGGGIQTTHSREAWQRFMEASQDPFEALAGARASAAVLDLNSIEQIRQQYERIATKGGVKYGDRSRMDRAAGHLIEAAREVILTRRRLATDMQRHTPRSQNSGLLEAAWQSFRKPPTEPSDREVYAGIMVALVELQAASESLALTLGYDDLVGLPALVEAMPLVSGGGANDVQSVQVADVVTASAMLIAGNTISLPLSVSNGTVSQRLRDLDRSDLLIHLHPISDRDARESVNALTRMQLDAHRSIDEAHVVAQRLEEGAHAVAISIRKAVEEARSLLKRPPHDVRPDRVADWINRVAAVGVQAAEQVVSSLRARIPLDAGSAALVSAALSEGRFVDAIALINGVAPAISTALRATLWRAEAETRYPVPLQALSNANSQSSELRRSWSRGLRMDARDEEIRKQFAALVFDSLTRLDKTPISERKAAESVVQSRLVRTWMARQGLNPSFLPQITQFIEVAIVLPPCLTTDDAFVRQTLAAVHRERPRIVVVLAPRLSRNARDAFRNEVRVRNAAGLAIIDDVDFVRILNPGGQQTEPLIALLEMVLEQQPRWSNVSPFEAREGQHTKAEMYVGRQEEAADLATKATYSRLFSGRRLGKSALLKHVSDAHRTRRLPSKNALRVVYVGIVGEVDERKVVDRIEQELKAQIEHKVEPVSESPAERLRELLRPFIADNSKESLLVFLDEADMFVEAQIGAYETRREDSLSWRMRTNLESKRDAMDLPRVRFVFAGYRATQRREGAWANWGDVLRLRPLSPEEGGRLIAGPLARLGIDATREASNIAFRCGYQPAVILRFGQLLLEYVDEVTSRSARDRAIVTAAHVAHVFQNSGLQQEIRTVVWNNFQGNPFGRIVFAALLLELARVPPGAELEDAPRRVWERLQRIAPDFLEGNSAKGSPLDRVARELRTFVDRSMLVDVSGERSSASYALLFPHHLPVLLQEDLEVLVRQEVEAFGKNAMDEVESVRSILPETAIDGLVVALSEGGELGVRAAVAASQWPSLLSYRAADLVERLQLEVSGPDARGHHDVSPRLAIDVLADRVRFGGRVPLFVGGVDLLRWARSRGPEVDVATVRRLQPKQIQWWFERVRGITFDGLNPIARFFELTGGVPFLLDLLNRQFAGALDGSTATESVVLSAIDGFRENIRPHASALRDGADRVRLEKRELELLMMYSIACRDWGEEWRSAMSEWDSLCDVQSDAVRSLHPLGAGDIGSLEVLVSCGLLPTDPFVRGVRESDRICTLSPADPVHRIADAVASWLSL